MFGPPGYTYVYLIYGMYSMLNFITEPEGFPAAVLIRAIEPLEGIDLMRARRQKANRRPLNLVRLTNGPGKLCQALDIDKKLHNKDVTAKQQLWLETGNDLCQTDIATGYRVGINYAAPQDRDAPWRFWIRGNRFVSPA